MLEATLVQETCFTRDESEAHGSNQWKKIIPSCTHWLIKNYKSEKPKSDESGVNRATVGTVFLLGPSDKNM